MKRISVTAPGKLYVMGEYSILTPGQTAVIVPAPFHLTAILQEADNYHLMSELLGDSATMEPDDKYALIQETISLVETFLHHIGQAIKPFHLKILGELGQEGKKFGLGSSGCVVVLVVKALLTFYDYPYQSDELFRLAALVLLRRGDTGSLGDLACISHEKLVAYRSFDRKRVREHLLSDGIKAVLASDWGYDITPIVAKGHWQLLVGWTQSPALSHQMVDGVKEHLTNCFRQEMEEATQDFIQALETGQTTTVLSAFHLAGTLLQTLDPSIYTKSLHQLVQLAESQGIVAKSSGAGGGDCGLALCEYSQDSEKLATTWREWGILPLATIMIGGQDES